MKYFNIHTHKQTFENFTGCEIVNIPPDGQVCSKFFSTGIHPWNISKYSLRDISDLLFPLLTDNKCLAVGEFGLDFHANSSNRQEQIDFFKLQSQIASELQLPCIIHCVKGFNELTEISKNLHYDKYIIHGYSKNDILAKQLVEKGFKISFGSALQSAHVQKALQSIPLEMIFLETDMGEQSIMEIYSMAANSLQMSVETLAVIIEQNFKTCFSKYEE